MRQEYDFDGALTTSPALSNEENGITGAPYGAFVTYNKNNSATKPPIPETRLVDRNQSSMMNNINTIGM